ncbi:MAG: hypothetical protein KQI35_05695 [Bacteroidetes bacterium]|nr:hypothetical protein [Bacteroidota bacterium]
MKAIPYRKVSSSSRCFYLLLITILLFNPAFSQMDSNPNSLMLSISGNGYSDQTFIIIIPGSTFGFDSQYDAYKLMGIYAAPQLYSIIPCCNLSVNAIPELYNGMEVQLGMRLGAENTYTISGSGLYAFGQDTTIILEDTKENVFLNLMIDSVYTFTGMESDDEERFKLHYYAPMRYDVKVLLEGAYADGGMMTAWLDSYSMLPNDQPYHIAPWNYMGTENVPFFPFNNVVDWVLLELRDAPDAASASAATAIEQQACLLLEDGTITGTDNESLPLFTEVVTQNAFIVVYHRNHLGIMSSGPLVRNGDTYSWDFTGSASQAYGTASQKDLGGGFFGLYAGDGNADGTLNNDDKITVWDLFVGKKGYQSADYNLDGQINNQDKNDAWVENVGQSIQYPQ